MWCEVGSGGVRTSITFWAGVWVVPMGAAGLVKRLAMGEPFGAISCGTGACEDVALLRFGDVGVSRCPRPPSLPPPRGGGVAPSSVGSGLKSYHFELKKLGVF